MIGAHLIDSNDKWLMLEASREFVEGRHMVARQRRLPERGCRRWAVAAAEVKAGKEWNAGEVLHRSTRATPQEVSTTSFLHGERRTSRRGSPAREELRLAAKEVRKERLAILIDST